jgi:Rrf2 family protein
VNLSLTKRADYAVRAALCLAERWDSGDRVTVTEVARRMSLPRTNTPQILGLLTRAGLAEARSGRGGGYRLTRSPSEISLLDVVEAGDGRVGSARCILRGGQCRRQDVCAVHDAWYGATESFRASLSRVALDEVAAALPRVPAPRQRSRPRTRNAADRSSGVIPAARRSPA